MLAYESYEQDLLSPVSRNLGTVEFALKLSGQEVAINSERIEQCVVQVKAAVRDLSTQDAPRLPPSSMEPDCPDNGATTSDNKSHCELCWDTGYMKFVCEKKLLALKMVLAGMPNTAALAQAMSAPQKHNSRNNATGYLEECLLGMMLPQGEEEYKFTRWVVRVHNPHIYIKARKNGPLLGFRAGNKKALQGCEVEVCGGHASSSKPKAALMRKVEYSWNSRDDVEFDSEEIIKLTEFRPFIKVFVCAAAKRRRQPICSTGTTVGVQPPHAPPQAKKKR